MVTVWIIVTFIITCLFQLLFFATIMVRLDELYEKLQSAAKQREEIYGRLGRLEGRCKCKFK